MSPIAWIAGAVMALVGLVPGAIAWWNKRKARKAEEARDAWRRRANDEKVRADAAEAVVFETQVAALERQAAIQKEIHDAATDRLAHPDPSARSRVQERWKRTDGSDRADVPASPESAVPDTAAGGPWSGAAGNPKLRGRR